MEESEERPQKLRKLDHDASKTAEPTQDAASSSANAQHEVDEAESTEVDGTESGNEGHNEGSPLKGQNGGDQPISKNQLKKLKKRQQWEDGRDDRKAKRKQKTVEKRERVREARREEAAKHDGIQPQTPPRRPRNQIKLPMTIMIDCGFDHLMVEKELISLGSQVTRAYADNTRTPFPVHLVISSWDGKLKERFDTVLSKHYENWKGVKFTSDDFAVASKQAWHDMIGAKGGKLAGAFEEFACFHNDERVSPVKIRDPVTGIKVYDARPEGDIPPENPSPSHPEPAQPPAERPGLELVMHPEEIENNGEIIYLTSDSPDTLQYLNPYSTYIVGGLVDKNRHKGICYKTACNKQIRTAKLPIGEYMEMQSRQVLATNHVVEIMLRWLECGDWGDAFMQVIPKRKGGRLRGEGKDEEGAEKEGEDEREDNEDDEDLAEGELKGPALGESVAEDGADHMPTTPQTT